MHNKSKNLGFTLVEALVAIALITVISLVLLGALTPWMGLKQKIDTERKLQDIRQGLLSLYDAKAMALDSVNGTNFDAFQTAPLVAGAGCADQEAAFAANATRFTDSPTVMARDGYVNPWCIAITQPQSVVTEGVTLYYRNIAIISTGRDGLLDAQTKFTAEGKLVTGGDDVGVTVSGYDVQHEKLKETLRRMNKLAALYETYFTTRFMAYPDRDITRYNFSKAYDSGGSVAGTGGAWGAASTILGPIGASTLDSVSAWEKDNTLQVGNHTESVGGTQVRSPASTGTGALPYTALIRAKLPVPGGAAAYATQVVVGNY